MIIYKNYYNFEDNFYTPFDDKKVQVFNCDIKNNGIKRGFQYT